ncbi:YggT family protein [Chloroflexota bacterium]
MNIFFEFIYYTCQLLTIAILLRAVLSWVSSRPNSLTVLLDRITEPVLAPLRRIMPRTGMFDFTPMVAIIILQLIASLLH